VSRQHRDVGVLMEVNSWLEIPGRKIGRRKRPYSGRSKGKDWVRLESVSGLIPSSMGDSDILRREVSSVVCLFT